MARHRMEGATVVITGASSGIGRAAAQAFAAERANLVLAARNMDALEEVADDCRDLGASALAVRVDVTNEQAVKDLARHAIDAYGGIDVWINNAGVTLFGRFEETPAEDFRRVMETNLFGYVHGARAVLPHFRARGHGVLINNASVAGEFGQPFTSAYVCSKWAIRGLSESLRQELVDAPGIHVCTLLPASIDTPLFQHGANYTGRAVKPMPPVVPAERVARRMVSLAKRPRREVYVGAAGALMAREHRLLPGLGERLMARQVRRGHFRDAPAAASRGNLYQPDPQLTSVEGGWRRPPRLGRRGRIGLAAAAGLALAAFPAAVWASRR